MTAIAVTIAGSDSGGGAGIQADLKTFSALGVYGASVIAALTAQNTKGVTGIHDVPPAFVSAQIDAVFSDLAINAVKIGTFALTGLAAGLAGAIATSRISMGQPQAGEGMELEAIAAVILGGTSIYGGQGAVWRSVAGVLLLALIGNAFNILNVNPFFKDLTTGLIIVIAVALSAIGKRRR